MTTANTTNMPAPAGGVRAHRSASVLSRLTALVLISIAIVAAAGGMGAYIALRGALLCGAHDRVIEHARCGSTLLEVSIRESADELQGHGASLPASAIAEKMLEEPIRRAYEHWGMALVAQPGILGSAVLNVRGELVVYWPSTPVIKEAMSQLPVPGTAPLLPESSARNESMDQPTVIALSALTTAHDQEPYAYVAVLANAGVPSPWQMASWRNVVSIVGLGMALMAVVMIWRINHLVLRPIRRLVDPGTDDGLPPSDLLRRDDEVGALAHRLAEASVDGVEARAKAGAIAAMMDRRVAREAEQFSRQLRLAEQAAEIDPLTGLANRRFVDARLEPLIEEQRARGGDVAVVLFDVDNFKGLNDTAGHAAGDDLLKFVASLLKSSLRSSDAGVRLGGDEFAIILANVPSARVLQIADRIVKLFAQRIATLAMPVNVTLSAGVASLRDTGSKCAAALLARADEALYAAKAAGKNMARCAAAVRSGPPEKPPPRVRS